MNFDDILGRALEGIRSPELGQQQREIARLEEIASLAGLDPALNEPRESMFGKFLNFIDKPKQMLMGVADAAFVRKDIGDIGVLGAVNRGLDERINAFDILRREGVESPLLRGAAGFGIEILSDPLNWITLGAKGAASAGGRALTKEGAEAFARLASTEGLTRADDIFRAGAQFMEKTKEIRRAPSDMKALLSLDLDDLARRAQGIDVNSVESLFAQPKLGFEMGIPFLGHLTGKHRQSVQELMEAGAKPGAIRKAFVTAGQVLNPDTLKLPIEVDLSPVADFIGKNSMALGQVLDKYNTALNSATELPGAKGLAAKGTVAVRDSLKTLNDGLKRMFSNKLYLGKDVADATTDYKNQRAAAREIANEEATQLFGKYLTDPSKAGVLKDATSIIDNAMQPFFDLAQVNKLQPDEQSALLKAINDISNSDIRDPQLIEDAFRTIRPFRNIEEQVDARLAAMLSNPEITDEVREVVGQARLGFAQMLNRETKEGVTTGLVGSYVSHMFTNAVPQAYAKLGKAGKGTAEGFQKARQYSTLEEAFKARGLVANTNLAEIYAHRLWRSNIAIAKKRYFNRVAIESGTPMGVIQALYKQTALQGPEGEAARAVLRRKGFADLAQGADKSIAEYAADFIPRVERDKKAMRDASLVAAERMLKGADDVMDATLYAQGIRPLDAMLPKGDELAKGIMVGGRKYVVPVDIAKAVDENAAAYDSIRRFASGSKLGEATLKLLDSSTNFLKRANTLPWPGYWTQNLIGDTFFRALDGGLEALDPGLYARTGALLDGTGALRTKTGVVISPLELQKILRENGLRMTSDDYLDIINAAADTDLDKYLAKQKGFLKNAKAGNVSVAMSVAHDKLRANFENFFRVNHLVHHLERGSSVRDAVRMSQEAMINYRDLTPTEQSLFRRMYMFYGWISKSTKKTINSMFRSPGDLQLQLKSAQGVAELFSSPDAAPSVDDYDARVLKSLVAGEQVAFPLGENEEGQKLIGRGFGLPLNTMLQQFSLQAPRSMSAREWADTFLDSTGRTIQKQFASANPAIKMVAEAVSGKNLYFDKPLNANFLRKLPSLQGAAEAIAQFPAGKIPAEVVSTLDKAAADFLGLVPDGKGFYLADPGMMWVTTNIVPGLGRLLSNANSAVDSRIPTSQWWARFLTGVRVEPNDPERNYGYEKKANLQNLIQDYSARERIKADSFLSEDF